MAAWTACSRPKAWASSAAVRGAHISTPERRPARASFPRPSSAPSLAATRTRTAAVRRPQSRLAPSRTRRTSLAGLARQAEQLRHLAPGQLRHPVGKVRRRPSPTAWPPWRKACLRDALGPVRRGRPSPTGRGPGSRSLQVRHDPPVGVDHEADQRRLFQRLARDDAAPQRRRGQRLAFRPASRSHPPWLHRPAARPLSLPDFLSSPSNQWARAAMMMALASSRLDLERLAGCRPSRRSARRRRGRRDRRASSRPFSPSATSMAGVRPGDRRHRVLDAQLLALARSCCSLSRLEPGLRARSCSSLATSSSKPSIAASSSIGT